ncbi:hypothetical protein KSP40_PGU009440 [Platanthera guangdongensis]|uniref:Uncharacterized protein n=1 Tax=Platanthera guangdongensis TaxID=2320717 RepID=A0ABR2N1N6_9ASPA
MFFYHAFIASGALGGLIAITRLISALANPSKTPLIPEILKDLGIDLGAILLFAFLYTRENKAKTAQLAQLSREERLGELKLRVDKNKIISINDLRGAARLVVLAGSAAYINESFKQCEAFSKDLIERGVLVVPFASDGGKLEFESGESEEISVGENLNRLRQLRPVNVVQWNNWIDDKRNWLMFRLILLSISLFVWVVEFAGAVLAIRLGTHLLVSFLK